jgi:PiT family inorganic phosphate transporter
MTLLLILLAVGFAFSMGAHYTGACMGMPHALHAVSARAALLIMAPLTLLGATFASHGVEHTVGHDLVLGGGLSVTGLVIAIGVAFLLTSLFNLARIPTSTIQILVFSVVGAALAAGLGVHWATVGTLGVIWVLAPPVAAGVGYGLTHLLDRLGVGGGQRPRVLGAGQQASATPKGGSSNFAWLGGALIGVGALASFTMGSNDVANATGSLVGTGTLSPLVAGLVGGLGLAAGVLTWGRPLLSKVAFDIVKVDRAMATSAQAVQAFVVLAAVGFGFFTSMNQALVGAMAGAGVARGRHTVSRTSLVGIVRAWLIGPGAGIALSYLVAWLVALAVGTHVLVAPT